MQNSQKTKYAMRQTFSQGEYDPSENSIVCLNTKKQIGNKPALIIAHPRGNSAIGMWSVPEWIPLYQDLCDEYVVCIADCGGGYQWGNMGTRLSIGAQISYVQQKFGVNPALKVGVMGISMGGLAAQNVTKFNPNLIAFCAGIVPATSIDDLMSPSNTNGQFTSEIDTAYGGYTKAMYGADWDPYTYRANFPNIRHGIWGSEADTICRFQFHQAMKDAKPNTTDLYKIVSSAGIAPDHGLAVQYAIEGQDNPAIEFPKPADWCRARRLDSF